MDKINRRSKPKQFLILFNANGFDSFSFDFAHIKRVSFTSKMITAGLFEINSLKKSRFVVRDGFHLNRRKGEI